LQGFMNSGSGEAWPTQETLANVLDITPRYVRDLTSTLVAAGYLAVVPARGRGLFNHYRIVEKRIGSPPIPWRKKRNSRSAITQGKKRNSSGLDEPENRNDGSGIDAEKPEQPFLFPETKSGTATPPKSERPRQKGGTAVPTEPYERTL